MLDQSIEPLLFFFMLSHCFFVRLQRDHSTTIVPVGKFLSSTGIRAAFVDIRIIRWRHRPCETHNIFEYVIAVYYAIHLITRQNVCL